MKWRKERKEAQDAEREGKKKSGGVWGRKVTSFAGVLATKIPSLHARTKIMKKK